MSSMQGLISPYLTLKHQSGLQQTISYDIYLDVSGKTGLPLGLKARKLVSGGFANNKGSDQPRHPRSLITCDQRLYYSLNRKYQMYTCYEQNDGFLASLCS